MRNLINSLRNLFRRKYLDLGYANKLKKRGIGFY